MPLDSPYSAANFQQPLLRNSSSSSTLSFWTITDDRQHAVHRNRSKPPTASFFKIFRSIHYDPCQATSTVSLTDLKSFGFTYAAQFPIITIIGNLLFYLITVLPASFTQVTISPFRFCFFITSFAHFFF